MSAPEENIALAEVEWSNAARTLNVRIALELFEVRRVLLFGLRYRSGKGDVDVPESV